MTPLIAGLLAGAVAGVLMWGLFRWGRGQR